MQKKFYLAYRTGGTENFKWNKLPHSLTQEGVDEKKNELEHMGYPTVTMPTDDYFFYGLPKTFNAEKAEDGKHWKVDFKGRNQVHFI